MSKDDGRWSTVIRVDIRNRFFSEVAPGTLVNDLLNKHYGEKPSQNGSKELPGQSTKQDAFKQLQQENDVRYTNPEPTA